MHAPIVTLAASEICVGVAARYASERILEDNSARFDPSGL